MLARATVGAAREPSLHRKYFLKFEVNYHSSEVENHLEATLAIHHSLMGAARRYGKVAQAWA